jgi:hypothetical protein
VTFALCLLAVLRPLAVVAPNKVLQQMAAAILVSRGSLSRSAAAAELWRWASRAWEGNRLRHIPRPGSSATPARASFEFYALSEGKSMRDYYDLGTYSRPVTTNSSEAQVWFDRGLVWCYGFNHEESVRCFRKAAEQDGGCAMAYWGIAYASGPNYNERWEDFAEAELREAVADARRATEAALARMDSATAVEQALIRALEQRYPSHQVVSHDELRARNDAYAASMRGVYAAFPDDLDVSALYAEGMINRTPWQLWDLNSGEPAQGADTLEPVAVLERALRLIDERGDAPHPERALRAADALRDLVPDAGHLRHMPSHIDVLCGHYYAGMVANDQAILADRKYLERMGPRNFYTLSRTHNPEPTIITSSSMQLCFSASTVRPWKRPMN